MRRGRVAWRTASYAMQLDAPIPPSPSLHLPMCPPSLPPSPILLPSLPPLSYFPPFPVCYAGRWRMCATRADGAAVPSPSPHVLPRDEIIMRWPHPSPPMRGRRREGRRRTLGRSERADARASPPQGRNRRPSQACRDTSNGLTTRCTVYLSICLSIHLSISSIYTSIHPYI